MKSLLLLMLLYCSAFAGDTMIFGTWYNNNAVASGGGGAGSPGVQNSWKTNTASGVTTTLKSVTVPATPPNSMFMLVMNVGGGTNTSITWNGSATGWTAYKYTNYFNNTTYGTYVWYLLNPTATTANLVFTHD